MACGQKNSNSASSQSHRVTGPSAATTGTRLRFSTATTNRDRKSTRLNSSHGYISYAVFCLKKKNLVATRRARRLVRADCPERAELLLGEADRLGKDQAPVFKKHFPM